MRKVCVKKRRCLDFANTWDGVVLPLASEESEEEGLLRVRKQRVAASDGSW